MDAQLAALVVHDLKNALGNLESQLMLVELEPSREGAATARASCEQLRRDLVAFLTVYRGEGLRAAVEDESPASLLRSLAEGAQRAHRGLVVNSSIGEDTPPFWFFDPRLVRLALDAALNNACRYARQGVTLGASQREDELVFTIDDDGPGPGHTAPGEWSTGLGTELCRAVARAHRNGERIGSVALLTRPEGGARFELRLP
jgi:signal transduction histidine kinase